MKNWVHYWYKVIYMIILLFLITNQSRSQNWSALYEHLDEKEKVEVDKAIKSIKQAGDITLEANEYYNEALHLQQSGDSTQSVDKKKLKKLESKAVDQQIKADKLFSEAYASIYQICTDHLKAMNKSETKNNDYQVKAAEMMNMAFEKKKDADKNHDSYAKASILSEVTGQESAAIENMILAICAAHDDNSVAALSAGGQSEDAEVQNKILLSIEKSLSTEDTVTKNQHAVIDQDLVMKYAKYMSDQSSPEPITVNRDGINGIDGVDVDKLKRFYQSYYSWNTSLGRDYNQVQSTVKDTGSNASKNLAASGSSNSLMDTTRDQELDRNNKSRVKKNTNNRSAVNTASSIPNTSEVRFMIQIAASRIPLSRAQIWAIYPGNLSVEVVKEGKWYKYRVTGFRFNSEASMVASESGVKNAWVLATYNGKDIKLDKAIEMTRLMEADYIQNSHKPAEGDIDFYVQVAASKVELSDNTLSELCSNDNPCREVIEAGWFKYQLFAGTDYRDALKLRKNMSPKSFIVAYKGGTKINLYNAIHGKNIHLQ